MKTDPKEYTVKEYSELIGVSKQAVQKQINTGKIKARRVGPMWLIKEPVKLTLSGISKEVPLETKPQESTFLYRKPTIKGQYWEISLLGSTLYSTQIQKDGTIISETEKKLSPEEVEQFKKRHRRFLIDHINN